MKRKIAYVLCLSLLLTVTGCAAPAVTPETEAEADVGTDPSGLVNVDPWNKTPEVFGNPVLVSVDGVTYACNIPDAQSIREDGSVLIRTEDNQILILGAPDETYPQAETLEDVFLVYLERIGALLHEHRIPDDLDYTLTLEEQEMVEVQERQMLKIRGCLECQEEDPDQLEWKFLGYAVQLSNGSYAYWLAIHYTGGEYVQLKRICDNMAYSFQEVPNDG